jgi:uncharacterized Zn finger protein
MAKPKITEKQIRNRADAKSFSKGRDYHRSGTIHATIQRGNKIEARCSGSDYEPYRVQATLSANGIEDANCTCPYDWGGDCKHITALLLTYLETPEVFVERATIREQLATRSKEDLIALIENMLEYDPSLQDIVDTPTPAQVVIGQPVDTKIFRQQMQQAFKNYDGYNDSNPHRVVNTIARTGDRFAQQQDWENALRIYSAIVEEALPDGDYSLLDDDGAFLVVLSEVLQKITGIFKTPGLADNDKLRGMALNTLIHADIWDVQAGGLALTDMVYDETRELIRPADVPSIRQKIEAAKAQQAKKSHGKWGVESFESFLVELDDLEGANPEVALERLRNSDVPALLVIKLLELNHHEEALSVLDARITYHGDWLQVLPHFVEAGLGAEAVQRVETKIKAKYDDWLIDWLIRYYIELGDNEAALKWQLKQFNHALSLQHYQAIHKTATALSQWETIRPDLLAKVHKEKRYDVLIQIYMYEEDWTKAWETLPQLAQVPTNYRWGLPQLELDLAKKSQDEFPERAIKVYTKFAHQMINNRERSSYAEAANFLAMVRDLYYQLPDEEAWLHVIFGIREQYPKLSALQDELNKAGLEKPPKK